MKRINAFIISLYLCNPLVTFSQTEADYSTPSLVAQVRPNLYKPSPDFIVALYQLMKDFHELLTGNNIQYWADGGTLIGAIRHTGIISWDWDLDIDIHIKDKAQFEALIPLFKKMKYQVDTAYWLGYKIYAKGFHERNKPSLDVFFWENENNEYFYHSQSSTLWARRDGKPIFIKEDELFPLKEYQFGSIKILAANNPIPYLDNMYGPTWQNVGYGISLGQYKKVAWILSDEDRNPAMPFGPLQEHVKKLYNH